LLLLNERMTGRHLPCKDRQGYTGIHALCLRRACMASMWEGRGFAHLMARLNGERSGC
jgi:hypothetical protein